MDAPQHVQLTRLRSIAFALVLGAAALATPNAFAGEVKFGAEPLETDDNGKITDAGRTATVKELKSLPGEELWPLHLWAKIDRGAPGPLYVEFYDKLPSGKRYKAWAYEHSGYDGESFVSLAMELEGNVGFNRNHTYTVEVIQVNEKGKNLKLASGSLKLLFTEGDPDAGDDDDDDDDEQAEQDELDSFAGGDEQDGDGDGGPPPVAPPAKKKGCSVGSDAAGFSGLLVLMLAGAGLARRRD